MNLKRIIYCLVFLPLCLLKAQDVHFSQFYLSPLSLNPANTGNYRGDFRFFGNYRSQWKELNNAYNTFSAGGDFNIFPSNINLSGGLIAISDKSGGNLNVTKILPSAAWHFNLRGYKLHIGLQPGYVIKTLDFYSHTFQNQFNWGIGSFDNTLPNGESNVVQQFSYFDLNSGVQINRKFGKLEPEIGFAMFHINKPKESFLNNANKLPTRNAINAALSFYIKEKIILKAYTLYGFTTKASDWVSGTNFEYILSKHAFGNNSLFAGLMWRSGINRNADAGIATVGFNYNRYTLGFSYDVTISKLQTAVDNRGAFEIAFIYRSKSSRLNEKVLPCERY